MSTTGELATRLEQALQLHHPPVAITIHTDDDDDDDAAADRTGGDDNPVVGSPQPAGCCFWAAAERDKLDTSPADHAHCSVGSYTHGFRTFEETASAPDVAALVAKDWVTLDDLATAPALPQRPTRITYEPAAGATAPDVILMRLTPTALMALQSARPDLRLTGKPQCQIVPLARAGHAAVSPGCAVSRVRMGLPAGELTGALPADDLQDLVTRLENSLAADAAVAEFARRDLTENFTANFATTSS